MTILTPDQMRVVIQNEDFQVETLVRHINDFLLDTMSERRYDYDSTFRFEVKDQYSNRVIRKTREVLERNKWYATQHTDSNGVKVLLISTKKPNNYDYTW